ncbi:MAG TPA: CRTAC1 family protein [Planctomycetota bacterium]|nr:CRTAC1 family protein [Planctomycetota bacterium]
MSPRARTTRTWSALAALAGLASCSDATQAAESEERPFLFVDVAAEAGLTLRNVSGDPRRWYIPESNGSGLAWLDADGDGDMDLFVGNGQRMTYVDDGARLEIARDAACALYRNDTPQGGPLRFVDVSAAWGADRREWVQAVATGDVDGDGDTDLYLANFDPDVLLVNEGGRFVDGTAAAGLGSTWWGTGAAFGDVDLDGDLDLYVSNYCRFDPAAPPDGGKRHEIEGVEVGWGPFGENQKYNRGAPDVFYLNDGRGRFTDATEAAGFAAAPEACSYAVVFSDVDLDGDLDVLVTNDLEPSQLFVNQGDGRFLEEGVRRGFAGNAEGKPTSAMGLMLADLDGDGDQDVLRTNFDFEPNSLHLNDGAGRFRDVPGALGLADPSVDRLGWGGAFFDADCDGALDLFVANGHVMPQAAEIGMSGWLMSSQLFEGRWGADGRLAFVDATARAGADLGLPRSARGAAFADADGDGDLDLAVTDLDEVVRLLENRTPRRGHWILVALEGRAPNTDGYGARVRVRAGGRTHAREARTNDGLYSSSDPRLHFGLGPVEAVEWVEVEWPRGARTRIEGPALDGVLVVREPEEKSR